jgi:phosphoglycerate dehydrogenase-like enzyme
MNVGLIGTGAIAELHAQVYRKIGFTLRVPSRQRTWSVPFQALVVVDAIYRSCRSGEKVVLA